MATNPAASSINVIQQISDDANLLHRFCHGGDAETVILGNRATPTVHSFLSSWIQFLHSVVIAGEAFTPGLEAGFFYTGSGSASSSSETTWLRTSNYCPVFEGRIYAVDFDGLTTTADETPGRIDIHFYDESKTWLSSMSYNIFFTAPASAKYIRLCFKFSSDVTAGSSPAVIVKDVVAGTRSAAGSNGKRAIAVKWHTGFLGYNGTSVAVGDGGVSGYYKYGLVFASKGDLVWLKAGQSSNQSIIACVDSLGTIIHKVTQAGDGTRDSWLDHMWIADQDTCVILVANTFYKSNNECIVYPNFLYNSDTFNDAETKKPGYINTSTGYCTNNAEEYDPAGTSYTYACSHLICLKKGQHISSASATYASTFAIGYYDASNTLNASKSVAGLTGGGSSDMNFFGYRCTDEFCFVRICGRVLEANEVDGVQKFLSYRVSNDGPLSGKSLAMLGDSYVGSQRATSYPRAASNLGMSYTSYGISGNTVSAYQENGMVNRYTQMADGFDYVGLVGGRNDYNNRANVPIGDLDSTDTSTFCGALNVLCEGLIKKYVGKKLFGVTSWNVNDEQNAYNDAFVAVVSGRWNIPVLQTYKGANVYMKVAEFRQAYCVGNNDVSHLNILGHMNLMAPMIEAFLKTL